MNTDLGIKYQRIEPEMVACKRFNLKSRTEIREALQALFRMIPANLVAGSPYCIIQYISSCTDGYDVEVGFPIRKHFESKHCIIGQTQLLEVLILRHEGPITTLRDTKLKLSSFSHEHGLISDEFTREVYPDWENPSGAIECQFVIHNWNDIFERNLTRVLGRECASGIMEGADRLGIDACVSDRFEWAWAAMLKLNDVASEQQRFDIVSSCAHVFPSGQLEKLRYVFRTARALSDNPFDAVDAVLAFMRTDPGWGEKELHREGDVIFHTKNPSDRKAYEQAQTPEQKRAAYCFCPIIRVNLDKGISDTYCYCGSGWYRQQWETATGKPVRVDVVKSVVRGDDVCQFAVHLASDI